MEENNNKFGISFQNWYYKDNFKKELRTLSGFPSSPYTYSFLAASKPNPGLAFTCKDKNSIFHICTQGHRTQIGQGEEELFWTCAREALAKFFYPPERFFRTLGMIFAPLWAYFFNFSLYIVRMAKSSWGGGNFPP